MPKTPQKLTIRKSVTQTQHCTSDT